ncbi:MAG TPA: hypothetical protein PLG02_08690 [Methylotenera sp.]|nr:hypothetical protein [Methylotenera sp.]
MPQSYEALSDTEKYFIVILLALYAGTFLVGIIFWGEVPCILDLEGECNFGTYFKRLLPFYGFTFAINIAIVVSAYYLNKLAKKSILIFRGLILPPLLCLFYYLYLYGSHFIKALF